MKRIFSAMLAILLAVTVSACQTTTNEVSKAATPGLTDTYYFRAIDVEFADKAKINDMLRLDNPEDAEAAKQIKANVERALRDELNQSFTGKEPAKLTVRIHSADVSSGAGRVMGSASFITTVVTVSEAKTGRTIKTGTIRSEQVPFRGSGNIGLLVMVAANAGTTQEKRYKELAEKYASDLVAWAK